MGSKNLFLKATWVCAVSMIWVGSSLSPAFGDERTQERTKNLIEYWNRLNPKQACAESPHVISQYSVIFSKFYSEYIAATWQNIPEYYREEIISDYLKTTMKSFPKDGESDSFIKFVQRSSILAKQTKGINLNDFSKCLSNMSNQFQKHTKQDFTLANFTNLFVSKRDKFVKVCIEIANTGPNSTSAESIADFLDFVLPPSREEPLHDLKVDLNACEGEILSKGLKVDQVKNWIPVHDPSRQDRYLEQTMNTIRSSCELLKGKFPTLLEMLNFLSTERSKLAAELDRVEPYASPFGKVRTEPLTTPMRANYAYVRSRAEALTKPIKTEDGTGVTQSSAVCGRSSRELHSFFTFKLEDFAHDLTQIGVSDAETNWYHSSAEASRALVKKKAAPLYEKLIQLQVAPENEKEFFEGVGELHWLMAHAAPYERGSAAIAENLTRGLLLFHGYHVPPYAEGMVPDLEALVEPNLKHYAETYASRIFAWPPQKVSESQK